MSSSYNTRAIDSMTISRLWAAKQPLAGESCASWIQRVCGDHQYSVGIFKRVLDHSPYKGDWDRPQRLYSFQRLEELVEIPGLILNHSDMTILGALSQTQNSSDLLRMFNNKPAYRWCPICFAEDKIPHLRWYWRLRGVRECWEHQEPLSEGCIACGEPIFVHRAILTKSPALHLSECAECGMSLSVSGVQGRYYYKEPQRKLRSIFAPWWMSGRPLSIGDAERLAAKYVYVVRDRSRLAAARFEVNVRRRHELLKQEKLWVLDGSCFREGVIPNIEKSEKFRPPWQWRVNPFRRLAVADALWTIRGELREMRGPGGGDAP
ncbi:TniQ family protein [Curvibacter sp. HBC28]|uniref:TniQ family protein n=1 Tax=Curvibacter microcysteis TaxID=3026419 RepID=A0ABT5MBT8_9BURK|nr:TniQ family protein [Curvibacter sp. HBC28]MDD0813374.1 TniQ family protein [Curvibacter sp. HBC28]